MKTKKNQLNAAILTKIRNGFLGFLFLGIVAFALPVSAVGLYDSGTDYLNDGFFLENTYGLPDGSILGIASNLLFWLLSLFAIVGIIGFVLSGIFYLISAGEEDMVTRGKDGMKWSIVGILVGLSGFIIMQAVNLFLGGASKGF